jgi:Ca-activated chloride channel family protein
LIAFAGKPIVKVPLTTDLVFFNSILNSVDTNAAPRGGTAIGDAIRKALAVMPPEQNRDAAIVLITDGEDQESMPLEAAKEAAARKVKILTVGLGDAIEGARIPVRDEKGNLTYLKHKGQEVWSKVDEKTLQDIARLTGGVYIAAKTNTFDLGKIYANNIAPLRGEEFQMEQRKKYRLQYQPFLAAATVLLMLFVFSSEYAKQNDGDKPRR